MTHYTEISARIEGMTELRNIIGALRSLAGMRMQEAIRALPGVRRYSETLATAVADTMPEAPSDATRPPAGRALVMCAAEHGFVGGFNERLLLAANEILTPDDLLMVVGTRGAVLARERRGPPAWTRAMATRCAAAPDTIRHVSAEIYRRIAHGEIERVDVLYAQYAPSGAAAIVHRRLLPLDPTTLVRRALRMAPLYNLDPVELHQKLLAEFVFAQLTEAAIESIASENAARFSAMQSAHDNVSRRLQDLRRDAHMARQAEITTEIVELIVAAKAMALSQRKQAEEP